MKKLSFILLAFLMSSIAMAQDFPYGEVTKAELVMKSYDKDPSAHAVVLTEYGKSVLTASDADAILLRNTNLNATKTDEVRLIFEYHVKIKILDDKGLTNGNIIIPTYNKGNAGDKIYEISGTTTSITDNGAIIKVDFKTTDITSEKVNTDQTNIKFTMPGLKAGCVIEYKYKSTSPFWQKLRPWYFQGNLPKIYSEYDAYIPGFWSYTPYMRGALNLARKSTDKEIGCFTLNGSSSDCTHFNYLMTDIPAFIEDNYLTAAKNYKSAIYFNLNEFTNPYTGLRKLYTKSWPDIDNDLKRASYFGGQIKRASQVKPIIDLVIAGKTNELDKAAAIYAYLQKSVKWDGVFSRSSDLTVSKTFANHAGNSGDINIGLVTALNAEGINTEAVLLSTRENGELNKAFANEDAFDYVIAKVNIADKSYFLDATEPSLAFGTLPLRCINGEGFVTSLNKPAYWIDIKPQQIYKSNYNADFTIQNDGKVTGIITRYSISYDAYNKRKTIKQAASTDEYIRNLTAKDGDLKIIKSSIANLDSLDKPLIETYEVEIKSHTTTNNRQAFAPYILDNLAANPFKLEDRNYPVDMGMQTDRRYVLTIHLPDQYSLETEPQKFDVNLPNKGGRFITDYQPGTNIFTCSQIVQLNRSIYNTNEYLSLKDLFDKVIQSQKAEFIFKVKI